MYLPIFLLYKNIIRPNPTLQLPKPLYTNSKSDNVAHLAYGAVLWKENTVNFLNLTA